MSELDRIKLIEILEDAHSTARTKYNTVKRFGGQPSEVAKYAGKVQGLRVAIILLHTYKPVSRWERIKNWLRELP